MTKRFKIITLGCRTNQYESQGYHDQLKKLGFKQADADEKAELCIINTCTVTHSADSSSRYHISKLARENPHAKIVVTGCFAEKNKEEVLAIDGVSHVVSNTDKEDLLSFVYPDIEDLPEFKIETFKAHTRAFVKVQDGCNSYCSYCVIPFVRGRSRSRKIDDIIKEVEELVKNGFKEIVLTGINIGDFDGGGGKTLADLVKAVDRVDGVKRLRLSSIDPDEVDDQLLEAIIDGKNTCPSMHIVLQSGSNVVLKRMRRKYTRQMFLDTVDRLKNACSHFTFTTDIIVGFPGETEADFKDTLEIIQKVQFAKVHMFPYSDRPKTRASRMEDKVSEEIKKERKQILMRTAEKAAFDLRQQYIHQTMTVLVEGDQTGLTENFLRVKLPKGYRANQLLDVYLVANSPDGLVGEVLDEYKIEKKAG